jgi:hypothetical protein
LPHSSGYRGHRENLTRHPILMLRCSKKHHTLPPLRAKVTSHKRFWPAQLS